MVPVVFLSVFLAQETAEITVAVWVDGQDVFSGQGSANRRDHTIYLQADLEVLDGRQGLFFSASTDSRHIQLSGGLEITDSYQDIELQSPRRSTVWTLQGRRIVATVVFESGFEYIAGQSHTSDRGRPSAVKRGADDFRFETAPSSGCGGSSYEDEPCSDDGYDRARNCPEYFDDHDTGCLGSNEEEEEAASCGGSGSDERWVNEEGDDDASCGGSNSYDNSEEDEYEEDEDEPSCGREDDDHTLARRRSKQRGLARALRFGWPFALVLGFNRIMERRLRRSSSKSSPRRSSSSTN